MECISFEHILELITRSLGRMDKRLLGHGERVAGGVMQLMTKTGGFTPQELGELGLITLLHDIGAYEQEAIGDLLSREYENRFEHARYGCVFIRNFTPFPQYAPVVLYHHSDCAAIRASGMEPRLQWAARCIHAVDTADLYRVSHPQVTPAQLADYLRRQPLEELDPAAVELLARQLDRLEEFLPSAALHRQFLGQMRPVSLTAEQQDLLLQAIVRAIDFRSRTTVVHCATVVRVSEALADLCGLDAHEREAVHYGALLHDLGKIAIPANILEFPGRLSPQDWEIMRSHVKISQELLTGLVSDEVLQIAVRHHETLDGLGYHRGIPGDQLTRPQRIVAVADVVTALTEQRSYKEAFSLPEVLRILRGMRDGGKLCPAVIGVFEQHSAELYDAACEKGRELRSKYDEIQAELAALNTV